MRERCVGCVGEIREKCDQLFGSLTDAVLDNEEMAQEVIDRAEPYDTRTATDRDLGAMALDHTAWFHKTYLDGILYNLLIGTETEDSLGCTLTDEEIRIRWQTLLEKKRALNHKTE